MHIAQQKTKPCRFAGLDHRAYSAPPTCQWMSHTTVSVNSCWRIILGTWYSFIMDRWFSQFAYPENHAVVKESNRIFFTWTSYLRSHKILNQKDLGLSVGITIPFLTIYFVGPLYTEALKSYTYGVNFTLSSFQNLHTFGLVQSNEIQSTGIRGKFNFIALILRPCTMKHFRLSDQI